MSSVSSMDAGSGSDRFTIFASGSEFDSFVANDGHDVETNEAASDRPNTTVTSERGGEFGDSAKSDLANTNSPFANNEQSAADFVFDPNAPFGRATQMISYAMTRSNSFNSDEDDQPGADNGHASATSKEDSVPVFEERIVGAGLTVRDLLEGDYSNLDLSNPFAQQDQQTGGVAALGNPMAYLSSMSAELS